MSAVPEPTAGVSTWPWAIRSLGHRNFRLYWAGQVTSLIGTWMGIVAQGWIVYELTHSPLMLGLVNFAALVPVVPVSLAAGVLSDRLPRRKLILVTEVVLMLQALTMAGLIWAGAIQVWHVILLSFVLGAAAAVEQPARLAFVMDVVGREDLSNAVALNASAYNTARIIGPVIAGLLIAAWGAAVCFFLNGVSFLAVIVAVLAIQPMTTFKVMAQERISASLIDGFHYIWDARLIRSLLLIVALSSFLTLPYIALMPAYARDVVQAGPTGLGYLFTGVGIGAILGALVVAQVHEGRRGEWLTIANILGPLFVLLFCFSRSLSLSLLLVVAIGTSNAIRQTLVNSLLQLNTQDAYHGRVMSIFNLLFNGMSRVGALGVGALAEFAGVPSALGASALLSIVVGLIVLVGMPHVRHMP